jgi:hypothetical protein
MIKIKVICLLMIGLGLGNINGYSQTKLNVTFDTITEVFYNKGKDVGTANYYGKKDEKELLKEDAPFISFKDSVYTIKLKNKKEIVLKNYLSDSIIDSIRAYTYLGKIQVPNFIVFYVTFYEGAEYLIINLNSGVMNDLWGEPIVSQNKKMIFSTNAYCLGGPNSSIQLYNVHSDSLSLTWEKYYNEGKGLLCVETVESQWINNYTLYLKQISTYEKDNVITNYTKMVLRY